MSLSLSHDKDAKGNPVQKTQGEKTYDAVFNVGLNFFVNLGISAAFTYWVSHSTKPIWKDAPFAKEMLGKSPAAAYENVVTNFMKLPFLQGLKTDAGKREVASRMADILTLTGAGHAVMIPTVWLGEKYKTDFVNWVDNGHYGPKDEQPVWVKERHHVIENEKKPSLLGAVVGRVGTVVATQTTAITVGSRKNVIHFLGEKFDLGLLKKFTGLDSAAGKIGNTVGEGISKALPEFSESANSYLRKAGNSFSHEQVESITPGLGFDAIEKFRAPTTTAKLNGKLYDSGLKDASKYTALDVLYTTVTSVTIHPIINFLKNQIPGMSYTQHSKEKPATQVAQIEPQGALQQANLATSR